MKPTRSILLGIVLSACAPAPAPPPPPAAPPAPPPPVVATIAATAPPAPVDTAPPPPVEAPKLVEAPKPAVAERTSVAVYYDANGRGACALTFGHDAAVLSAPNSVYNQIEACGQCLEITGPAGTAVAMVVDRCNDCPEERLVINKPTFDKIAGKGSSGHEQVKWKPVPCDTGSNVELRIKKTSSEYWTAVQVRNHRLPVHAVAFKKEGAWVDMTRSQDNYFVAAKGVGKGAMTLRITASDGQVVEETLDKWKDGETYKGKTQFK